MEKPKRILILTADVGFGHRSAANAVAAALKERYGERVAVEIANPMDDERTPAVLRDSQTDYDRLVREMPEVYKLRYELSDAALPSSLMESAVTVMLYGVMQDYVHRYQPDVIVTTHPMYPAPLAAVNAVNRTNIPWFTVITDLGQVHRMWFNPASDLVLVPTSKVKELALENNIPEEKVVETGIPVNPKLVNEKRSPQEIRAELGWRPDMITGLIVGSKRVKNLEGVLRVLNHAGFPVQYAVVAGGNTDFYQQLQAEEWHGVFHLYNYVENVPAMMRAADFIICKAGGLIVTEALAGGLPVMLVDVTPGQEEGNAAYILANGAADRASTPLEALEILCHWLANDGALLRERARAARTLGRPESAYTIAEYIWAAAERGPLPIPENRQAILPKLLNLLSTFGLVKHGQAGTGDQPTH